MIRKHYRFAKLVTGAASILSLAISLCIYGHTSASRVQFLEVEQYRLDVSDGPFRLDSLTNYGVAVLRSGVIGLRGLGEETPGLEDKEAVFSFIFSQLPSSVNVLPTEGFYYYSAFLNGQEIRGNIRLADAFSKQEVSFAYFIPEQGGATQTWVLDLSPETGLEIQSTDGRSVALSWKGKSVRFNLPDGTQYEPDEATLLEEERSVGRIFDESGIAFFLLFNEETRSFYNVLDEDSPFPGELVDHGDGLLVCPRSSFAFYDDPAGRKILIGVHLRNVEENNFFDGPGDQVPYQAFLKDTLYMAYPQTALASGIDEHGVYLDKAQWVRVAICPFHRYVELNSLHERITKVASLTDPGQRATEVTREWWNNASWRGRIREKLRVEGKQDPSTGLVSESLIELAVKDRMIFESERLTPNGMAH